MTIEEPLTRLVVYRRYVRNKDVIDSETLEGEVHMSQQQQDAYKGIIGDGLAKVTVSRQLGEQSFGNGGNVFVSVTLTCDQSQAAIGYGVELAKSMANFYVEQHFKEMEHKCYELNLLQPKSNQPAGSYT